MESGSEGESPSLPLASALAGPASDPGEQSANEWRLRCRQRRQLYQPVNAGGQTYRETVTATRIGL